MRNRGNILSRTFSLFAAGWLPYLSISFVIHSPLIAFDLLLLVVGGTSKNSLSVGSWVYLGAQYGTESLVTAALVCGVFSGLQGKRVTTVGCLRGGLSRWLPVVGLSLLLAVATSVGLLLCLVPGIVIACGLFVAVPALIVEKLPVTDAMSRSWSLTQGYKLPIFGVLLVLGIVGFGAETLLEKLSLGLVGKLVFIPMTALRAIAASVTYYEIRLRREEVDADELASAFD